MDEGQCTVLLLLLPNLPSNFQHFLFPRGQGRSRGKYKGSQVPRSSSPKDLIFLQPGKKLPAFKKDYIMKYYSQQWILKVWNSRPTLHQDGLVLSKCVFKDFKDQNYAKTILGEISLNPLDPFATYECPKEQICSGQNTFSA